MEEGSVWARFQRRSVLPFSKSGSFPTVYLAHAPTLSEEQIERYAGGRRAFFKQGLSAPLYFFKVLYEPNNHAILNRKSF